MTSTPQVRRPAGRDRGGGARRRPGVPTVGWLAMLTGWMPLGAVALDPTRPSAVMLVLYVLLLLTAMLVTFLRGAAHGLRRDPAGGFRSVGAGTAALAAGAVLALPLRAWRPMPVGDLALAVAGGAAALALLLAVGGVAGIAWHRMAGRVIRAGGFSGEPRHDPVESDVPTVDGGP